jgi:protein kinase X
MLAGYPPFSDNNPFRIYEKILAGKIDWPKQIDLVAKDLIKKLLVNDRTKRLGSMKNGADDVKNHKWFKEIDWCEVVARKLAPPIVPKINHEGDTSNFEKYPEDTYNMYPDLKENELKYFEDF